jgi:hypothetical protein
VSTDAEEAIQWLDNITSDSDNPASKLVHLEAPLQLFEKWTEVEKFMLPETLLSMESDNPAESEILTDSLADLRMDAMPDNASVSSQESVDARTSSPISVYSAASPGLLNASPYREAKAVQPIGHGRPSHKKSDSNVSSTSTDHTITKRTVVPKSLQPFFNHLLWRINQGADFAETMESYILVTNDAFKQQIGQRFGVRCKRLEQLREIIAREERDIRNREQLLKKENQTPVKEATTETEVNGSDDKVSDDDDDEVVFKRPPPKAPQAMNGKQVVDPNSFGGRNQNISTRGGRGVYRGARGSPASNSNNRGGGNFSPRNTTPTAPRKTPVDLTKPIDPDSYARPTSARGVARGGRRRLWEPT